MRRVTALLLALLLLSACGESPTVSPAPDDPDTAATPTPEATEPADAEPTEPAEPADDETEEPSDPDGTADGATTTAFFVRSHDSGFWVEPATGQLAESTVAVARAAMEFLVAGEPDDPNLETLAGPGVSVLGVNIDDDVLIVDLSEEIRTNRTGGAGEEAFAQQLAYTAAQFDGVEAVELHVDGGQISELWGHIDWSQPISPEPFALSPITFDSHTWGEQVPAGEVTVGGEANTFEATVELRLIDPDGTVVEETFTTATSGSGERGTWEHTFTLDGSGTWTIEAIEPDPSDGEGRPPFTTTLELRSA